MTITTITTISTSDLSCVCGGLPNGIPSQKQPEPQTWVDRLNRNLGQRGYNPNIDPGGERKPANPNVDPGIHKPWDPFKAPPTRGNA